MHEERSRARGRNRFWDGASLLGGSADRFNTADESHRGRVRSGRIAGLAWLFYLGYPLATLFKGHHGTTFVAISLLGMISFVAIYVYGFYTTFFQSTVTRRAWIVVVLLALVAAAMSIGLASTWLGMMIFVATAAGCSIDEPVSFFALAGIGAFAMVIGLSSGLSRSEVLSFLFQLVLIGIALIFLRRLIRTNAELRLARVENARLAVSEERLRFARDLHDLLGHSLSVIALKSELAWRLVDVNPERAKSEVHDIEQVTREALREVRDAVSGYRQPALDAELIGARAALDAASIDCDITRLSGPLPPAIEATLGWAVREGVTNVIRHSRASHCNIRIHQSRETVVLTIVDNGMGGAAEERQPSTRMGSGLTGLNERIAAQRGLLETGPVESGGFKLSATLPLLNTPAERAGESSPSTPRIAMELSG